MAKTFMQMVKEAREEVGVISPADAKAQIDQDPNTRVIDVRQADDRANGAIPGALNIPLGLLAIKADTELPVRDERLEDRDQPIIIACGPGGQGALGGKVLHDMGFTNVKILDGGTNAWEQAGLPMEKAD